MEDYFKTLIDKLKHGELTSEEMIRCLENTGSESTQQSTKQTLPSQMSQPTYESVPNTKDKGFKSPKYNGIPSCTTLDAMSPIYRDTTMNNSKTGAQDLNTLRTEFEKLQKKLEGLGKIEKPKKNIKPQSPDTKGAYFIKTEVSSIKPVPNTQQFDSYPTFSKPTEENKTLSTNEDQKNLKNLKSVRDERKKRKSIEIPKCDISKIKMSENDEEGNVSNREDIEILLDDIYKNDKADSIQNLYSKYGFSVVSSKPTTSRKTIQAKASEASIKTLAKSQSQSTADKPKPKVNNLMTLEYSPKSKDQKNYSTTRGERGSSSGKASRKKETVDSLRESKDIDSTDVFELKQKGFYERQIEYEKIKLQHMIKVYRETQPTLKPNITQKSREIVEAKHIPDLMTKVEDVIKNSPKKLSTSPKKKPPIVSAVISDDYYNKQVKSFLEQKETKLEQMRKLKSDKEVEGFTGKPEVNKKVGVNSKIGIGMKTSEYIEQLKEKEQIKQQYKELVEKRKEMRETIECTHQPQINPTPKYLKEKEREKEKEKEKEKAKEKEKEKEKENNPAQSQIRSLASSKNSYLAQSRSKELSQSRYKDIQPKKNHLRLSYSKNHRMDIPDLFAESVPPRMVQETPRTDQPSEDRKEEPKAEDLEIENIYFSPSDTKNLYSKPPPLALQEVQNLDSDVHRKFDKVNVSEDDDKENEGEEENVPLCLEDLSTKLSTIREKKFTDMYEYRIKPLNLKPEIIANNEKLLSSPSFRGGDKSFFTMTSQRQEELRGHGFDTIVNI